MYDTKGATNDITNMVNNWSSMLNNLYNKDTSSDNLSNAFFGASRGMSQGIGRQALANAIGGFSSGYQQSEQANQERKDKQLQQLMTLGLTGQQLKMEAAKLGITAAEVPSKIKMQEAAAYKYMHPTAAGAGLIAPGPIGVKDLMAVDQKYQNLATNPKSDPLFYNGLPIEVQKQLDLPKDSTGYKTGMANVAKIAQAQHDAFIDRAHKEGARYKTSQMPTTSDE
jgi:hypothetical protein